MRERLPLRITVPIVLFLLGLLLSILSITLEKKATTRALEELMRRHVNFIGNNITGVSSYFLAREDLPGLKQQVAQLGSDIAMQTALVCDADGRVLTSSRFAYIGLELKGTHLGFLAEAVEKRIASTTISKDGRKMIGVFPFLLPPRPGELVAQREGVVVLEYDLTLPKARLAQGLIERGVMVVTALGVVCCFLWFFFHKLLASRIERLVEGTRKVAAGDPTARMEESGFDELAALGKAFNEMAGRVEINRQELTETNQKLQNELEQREAAQTALWASEQRFRSVWENSKDPMRLTDGDGKVVAANETYLMLTGLPAEQVIGKCFLDHHMKKDVRREREEYQKGFAERTIALRQNRKLQFKGGQEVHLEIAYSYIEGESGKPLLLGIFRDVTERVNRVEELRRAKEFSENLIRSANVLIIGLTNEGKVQIFNDTAEKALGWKKEEVIGNDWFHTFIPPGVMEEIVQAFAEVKSGGYRQFENAVLTRNGEERTISWQNNEIVQDGTVTGTLSFGIDITEQRREEAKNRELERKLLEGQKLESLGILAGGIAHDFNNLLQAILGNASLAGMHLGEDSPARPLLETIEKTSVRAADLCNQMLAYAGKGRMSVKSIYLNELVHETTELLQVSISKKARLIFDLQGDLPGIEGDQTQVQQVLMNLVMNASEALGEEEGIIRIRTGVVEGGSAELLQARGLAENPAAGGYVYLEVADNGCGMSSETQERIFDPFFTTKFTGRGLGLAAVLGIVRSHQGALQLNSAEGKGSTFRILFPAMKRKEEAPQKKIEEPNWKGKGTVLVVDDDAQVRDLTSRILRRYGFEVLNANDGAEGVRVFRENSERVDLVLMDMTMPRLNGSEAFAAMRCIKANAKGLLMSGYSEPLEEKSIEQGGWSGFVQKPFKPDQLGEKVKLALASKGC